MEETEKAWKEATGGVVHLPKELLQQIRNRSRLALGGAEEEDEEDPLEELGGIRVPDAVVEELVKQRVMVPDRLLSQIRGARSNKMEKQLSEIKQATADIVALWNGNRNNSSSNSGSSNNNNQLSVEDRKTLIARLKTLKSCNKKITDSIGW
jgi:hypothetical protein